MLQAAPSLNVARDQLTVYFNYAPKAIITLNARLLKAYDPYGAIPPGWDILRRLTDVRPTAQTLANLHQTLATRDRAFGKPDSRTQGVIAGSAKAIEFDEALLGDLGAWFALGGLLTPVRDHLFSPKKAGQPVGTGTGSPAPEGPAAALNALATMPSDDGWLSHDQTSDLAALTLWARYEELTKANSPLVTTDEPPKGAPKETWTIVQRIMKIVTLAKVLRDSIELAPARERAAVLLSPAFLPLLDYVGADMRERAQDYAKRLLALPMHPWIAEAERLRLPAKRYTEWGNASYSMGLSGGEEGMWSTIMRYAVARNGGGPSLKDIRDFVTAEGEGGFLSSFVADTQDFFMLRDMFDKSMIAQAESALGLTSPSNPPPVHLHGQTWKALVQTGAMASEAVTDVAALMLRPRYALLNGEGWSDLAGNTDAFLYNAMFWASGRNGQVVTKPLLHRPDQQVPLFVQPQHPEHIAGYGLRELTPEMIRPVVDGEYFGDEDAVFRPYSVAGLAALLGFPSEEALLGSTLVPKLGHLFRKVGNALQPLEDVKATRIFHSSRTRQPWRKAVHLPKEGLPTQTMAMDERTTPSVHDIEAVIIRTPDQPAMTASMFALGDAAAIAAAKTLGVTL